MNSDLILFARRMKNLRTKRNLTMEKLAELCDLTPNHIAKLEAAKSNPSFLSLSKIATALNVEIKELFNFDELQDENYIKDEFNKLIKYSSPEHIKLLYKIHKDIIN